MVDEMLLRSIVEQKSTGTVVLCGAGNNARKSLDFLKSKGCTKILCFTDKNVRLHFNTLLGYEILPLDTILKQYHLNDLFFYVTPDGLAKKEIYETLRKSAVSDQQILNCREWEYKRGCALLEDVCVVGDNYLRLCYVYFAITSAKYNLNDYIIFGNIYEEKTISDFIDFRNERAKNVALNLPSPCNDCQFIETKAYHREKKIRYLNTIISNPCNLNCIYCVIHDKNPNEENVRLARNFIMSTFIKCLQKTNVLSDKIFLDISAGEYSLLTEIQKDDILYVCESYVEGGQLLTNAVQYDSKLEYTLRKYRHIGIYTVISLDAGTPETYHAVKGANVFKNVCQNIKDYVKNDCEVRLKYNFLPQNSTKSDVDGFVKFCIEVQKISKKMLVVALSRDFGAYRDDLGEMLYFIVEMHSRLNKSGIFSQILKDAFTVKQYDQIVTLADLHTFNYSE